MSAIAFALRIIIGVPLLIWGLCWVLGEIGRTGPRRP